MKRTFCGSESRVFLLVPILFLAALNAYAQAEPVPQAPAPAIQSFSYAGTTDCSDILKRVDADQDGYITRNEWERFFANADTDGDERLSLQEIRPVSQPSSLEEELNPNQGRSAAFERLDVNKNGTIELSEWPGKDKNFRYLDANHDGTLSREEFLSRNGRWWNEKFENLDFNNDGLIDRSEWLDYMSAFDRLDRDRNGVIERHEFYNPR